MRLLTPSDYRRMRWKNDGGWTSEIATSGSSGDRSAGNYDWRISIAEIERDGAFSSFPGFDRQLLVLDGAGIALSFDQAPAVTLRAGERAAPFAGEWQTHCRLLDGPTRDFNVIARRGQVEVQLLRRPLVGSMWLHASAGHEWLVHMLAGSARIDGLGVPLESGSSLWLDAGSGHRLLDGGGELIVVRLTRQTAQPAITLA